MNYGISDLKQLRRYIALEVQCIIVQWESIREDDKKTAEEMLNQGGYRLDQIVGSTRKYKREGGMVQ